MSMNSTLIPLNSPITKVKTIVYTQIEIRILNFILGNNECEIQVLVYNEDKTEMKSFVYLITGATYLDWNTDLFIYTWVQNKLRQEIF